MYWIDLLASPVALSEQTAPIGRLAIMARPRSGDWLEDEITGWKAEGIDTVVSLLEFGEVEELCLSLEALLCGREGLEFISFPIPDRGVPASSLAAANLARSLLSKLKDGKNIAVHCRAGIGRSSVVAACVMVIAGSTVSVAFDRISAARGVQVPDTEGQRDWVCRFETGARI